jgi:hypothetical protein
MKNRYEEKQANRLARFEALARNAAGESNIAYRRAKEMSAAIPFGQPILIGHHSEKRDRNYRERVGNTFRKAFTLSDKAEYYARRRAEAADFAACRRY